MPGPHRIAYLVSAYPATSHVFILREVLGLRARGFVVHTISINADARQPTSLSEQERDEQSQTIVIKNWPRLQMIRDVFSVCSQYRCACWVALIQSWKLAKPGLRGHALALAYWLEAVLVTRSLHTQQIKHLHVHFGNEAAMVGVLCKSICHCQLSYTIHGPDEFYEVRTQQLSAKVAAADLIICISQFARSQLMLISRVSEWAKIQVIRLGINTGYALAGSSSAHTPPTLLCVGRLTPAKGQRVLLQAMQRLGELGLRPRLLLAGAGEDEAQLRNMVLALKLSDQVQFLGALNSEAVRSLYLDADIFVLPSFAEGIPVVLMEAMASGLPCISSQITGIPELIEHGQSGLLVSAGDATGLCMAIKALIDNPQYAQELARKAKMQVVQTYNLERNLDQLARSFGAIHQEPDHA